MNRSMSKTKMISFYVEGPDWSHSVSLDSMLFDDERSQLFEAASLGLEKQFKNADNVNVGALVIVKKTKTSKKEAFVNSYICLINIGMYELAENLRVNFKKETGNDLAEDKIGYTFES
jgi:hypothetical protein